MQVSAGILTDEAVYASALTSLGYEVQLHGWNYFGQYRFQQLRRPLRPPADRA